MTIHLTGKRPLRFAFATQSQLLTNVFVTVYQRVRVRVKSVSSHRVHAFMQNDRPRANVTDDSSDSNIKDEDEADWHDKVNVEELTRHRSELSQAMNVEVCLHFLSFFSKFKAGFVDANMAGFGHIIWTFHITRCTYSQLDSGHYIVTSATSQASGNDTPPQQSDGSGAPSQQVGGGGAVLPQRGGDAAISMPEPVMPLWPADTDLKYPTGLYQSLGQYH
jgi:hypothetical protein